MQRVGLIVELGVIFVCAPLMLALRWLPLNVWTLLTTFGAVTVYVLCCLWRQPSETWRLWVTLPRPVTPYIVILSRFVLIAVGLWFYVAVFEVEPPFHFVRQSPRIWIVVMVVYPLMSALPQELIYRVFFFQRYTNVIGSPGLLVLGNAALFALLHSMYGNFMALVLPFLGGLMFAGTYLRYRSLLLVTMEHTLYGCWIFTVGLGRYFYHGSV